MRYILIICVLCLSCSTKKKAEKPKHFAESFYHVDEVGNCILDSTIHTNNITLLEIPDSFSVLTSIAPKKVNTQEVNNQNCYVVIGSIYDRYTNSNVYTRAWYVGQMPPESFIEKQIWRKVNRSERFSKESISVVNIIKMTEEELRSYLGCTEYISIGKTDKQFCR